MATIMLVAFACLLLFLFHWRKNKSSALVNWPVVGMLPRLVLNRKNIPEFMTATLKKSGGTLRFKGPWFSSMDIVFTSDPANIHHIFNKSSSKYLKGPEFKQIMEPLGDGITVVDSDSWLYQRKMIHKYFNGAKFQLFLERTIRDKVVNSMYPLLDRECLGDTEVNIEDVINRLGFDIICLLILGHDPESLSMKLPEVISYEQKAINEMEEVLLYRNLLPSKLWRLMRWLQLGEEKKLTTAMEVCDRFMYQCIESKLEKPSQSEKESCNYDFLTTYLIEELLREDSALARSSNPKRFIRDIVANLLVAGRDTSSAALSWLLWLLAKNPRVESKILEEISERLGLKNEEEASSFCMQELDKLVYLHATLCETLRLFPSLPINYRVAEQQDTLPSGHEVGVNTKIFVSYYAMGRMEDVWGKDCLEFKPERWISDRGEIVHVPSYKFSVFSAGQRTCVGKNVSFVQMKIIAVAILLRYRLQIVEDHPVEPSSSLILHMKHGMKVRVTKRSVS